MPVTAALLWYLVVFDANGGLAMTPTAFPTAEECQAALEELQASYPSAAWELHCLEPGDG